MTGNKIYKAVGAAVVLAAAVLVSPGFLSAQEDRITETLQEFSKLDQGQRNMVLSAMGVPDTSGFTMAKMIAWFVFGGIGFVLFSYGTKERSIKPVLFGVLLMGYAYFIQSTFWLYAVGLGLCAVFYYWRD